jgi:ribosomal protein S18 acetylase RimI-like enzyme
MSQGIRIFSGMAEIREIMSVYQQVWPNSFGIIDLLSTATECFLLEAENHRIIGYAFVQEDQKRKFVELQDIAVLPDHRKKNGGKRLMEAIQKKYPFIKLIARATHESLIAFYRELGFSVEQTIENYYEVNQDGLRMVWRSAGYSNHIK